MHLHLYIHWVHNVFHQTNWSPLCARALTHSLDTDPLTHSHNHPEHHLNHPYNTYLLPFLLIFLPSILATSTSTSASTAHRSPTPWAASLLSYLSSRTHTSSNRDLYQASSDNRISPPHDLAGQ